MMEIDMQLAHIFNALSVVTRDIRELEAHNKKLEDFVQWLEDTYDFEDLANGVFPAAHGIKQRIDALRDDKKATEFLKDE